MPKTCENDGSGDCGGYKVVVDRDGELSIHDFDERDDANDFAETAFFNNGADSAAIFPNGDSEPWITYR